MTSEQDKEAVSQTMVVRGAENDTREDTEEKGSEEKEKNQVALDGATDEAPASPTLSYAPTSPPLSPLSPPLSPLASPTAPPSTPPSSPIPSLRLSLSSPKRYTDALNCGGRRSYAETLNCGNGGMRSAITNCSDRSVTCAAVACGPRGGGSPQSGDGTISLAAMTSTYGEECNICLGQFQVGDRAAWRRDDDAAPGDGPSPANGAAVSDDDANDSGGRNGSEGGEAAAGQGCDHVFHEECISRWLLVRDGCPICRRPYFSDAAEDPEDATNPSAAGDGPAAGANSGDVGIDLELGVVTNVNNSGGGSQRGALDISAVRE